MKFTLGQKVVTAACLLPFGLHTLFRTPVRNEIIDGYIRVDTINWGTLTVQALVTFVIWVVLLMFVSPTRTTR